MRAMPAHARGMGNPPFLLRPFVKATAPMPEWRRRRAWTAMSNAVVTSELAFLFLCLLATVIEGLGDPPQALKTVYAHFTLMMPVFAYCWAVHVWAREFPGHRSYRSDRWPGDSKPTAMDRFLHEPWKCFVARGRGSA